MLLTPSPTSGPVQTGHDPMDLDSRDKRERDPSDSTPSQGGDTRKRLATPSPTQPQSQSLQQTTPPPPSSTPAQSPLQTAPEGSPSPRLKSNSAPAPAVSPEEPQTQSHPQILPIQPHMPPLTHGGAPATPISLVRSIDTSANGKESSSISAPDASSSGNTIALAWHSHSHPLSLNPSSHAIYTCLRSATVRASGGDG